MFNNVVKLVRWYGGQESRVVASTLLSSNMTRIGHEESSANRQTSSTSTQSQQQQLLLGEYEPPPHYTTVVIASSSHAVSTYQTTPFQPVARGNYGTIAQPAIQTVTQDADSSIVYYPCINPRTTETTRLLSSGVHTRDRLPSYRVVSPFILHLDSVGRITGIGPSMGGGRARTHGMVGVQDPPCLVHPMGIHEYAIEVSCWDTLCCPLWFFFDWEPTQTCLLCGYERGSAHLEHSDGQADEDAVYHYV